MTCLQEEATLLQDACEAKDAQAAATEQDNQDLHQLKAQLERSEVKCCILQLWG